MAEFKNYGPLFDLVNKQLKIVSRGLKKLQRRKKIPRKHGKKVSFFDKFLVLFGTDSMETKSFLENQE